MATLLELYQHRFGNAVKPQGNGWNGPCPLCGGTPGKSDRFMVWPERDQNMGQTCAEHHIPGIWSCRQCGKGGDSIEYLMQVEGLDFKGACAELGIEKGRSPRRRAAPKEPRCSDAPVWTPRTWDVPSAQWIDYATRLLDEASEAIWSNEAALAWLAARGITEDAIRAYHIGYLTGEGANAGRYRARAALGLPDKTDENGKVHRKMFIPRGIVIPSFAASGRVINLRLRRPKVDYDGTSGGWGQKYIQLEGSCKAPLLLRATGPRHMGAYFVTEAELDAVLIHHATGGVVGALAVRSNRNKPDSLSHELLQEAVRVAIALDYDAAGAEGVSWWESVYPQCVRWPVPEGKDPGDAVNLGVDIRAWVSAALPASIAVPERWGAAPNSAKGFAPLDGRQGHDAPAPSVVGVGASASAGERHPADRQEDGEPRSASAAGTTLPANESESRTGRAGERHPADRQDDGEPRSASAAGTTLPASESESRTGRAGERHPDGRVDAFFSGVSTGGEGAKQQEPFLEGTEPNQIPSSEHIQASEVSVWSAVDASYLQQALPSYLALATVPEDVCRAYLLWRGKPFTFVRSGNGGWEWKYNYSWAAAHRDEQDAFLKFVNASEPLWDWLSGHKDTEITSHNLLNIWG